MNIFTGNVNFFRFRNFCNPVNSAAIPERYERVGSRSFFPFFGQTKGPRQNFLPFFGPFLIKKKIFAKIVSVFVPISKISKKFSPKFCSVFWLFQGEGLQELPNS